MLERRSFDARPESVREARRLVRKAALDVGADPGVAELLASELATNAVIHARSPFEVRMDRKPDALRVEVVDPEPDLLPVEKEPSDRGGRGLAIIDALAQAWGSHSCRGWKTVWFELPAAGSA